MFPFLETSADFRKGISERKPFRGFPSACRSQLLSFNRCFGEAGQLSAYRAGATAHVRPEKADKPARCPKRPPPERLPFNNRVPRATAGARRRRHAAGTHFRQTSPPSYRPCASKADLAQTGPCGRTVPARSGIISSGGRRGGAPWLLSVSFLYFPMSSRVWQALAAALRRFR